MSDPFKTEDEKHNDRVIRDLALDRRLDRLCVIAAGVASAHDGGWFQEENTKMTAAIIARASRAILAKLEEE